MSTDLWGNLEDPMMTILLIAASMLKQLLPFILFVFYDKCMASRFTIYWGYEVILFVYKISYILYKISHILNKIFYIYQISNILI